MSLARYRSKRDFSVTPEPPPATRRSGRQLGYFIQRHHARALHYDFRLELGGVLKSWAVPKGPSLDPQVKRLAVQVEDHPFDYGSFEGTIPAHQYGAGEVVLWDRGQWLPLGDPVAGLKKGRLEFELRGVKLHGRWILVRMENRDRDPKGKSEKENWLLIKEKDDQVRTGKQADITALRPDSVADAALPPPAKAKGQPGKNKDKKQQGRFPGRVDAQLATLTRQAPEGDAWLSEMKFDGYRGLCRIEHGRARIFTREHHDWSKHWPQLIQALERLAASGIDQAWIDGEVVALLDDGSISFEALHDPAGAPGTTLAMYVFDLLWLNGEDVRGLPLTERKRRLRELVPGADDSGLIRFSEHVVGEAAAVYRHACLHGMEGTVIKRADAVYTGRRDRNWLKLKCSLRQEFVIGGYTDPAGSRSGFGALLIGVYDAQKKTLRYAGRVGTGFDERQLMMLSKRFAKLIARRPAFADPPRGRQAQGVHWLKPELVAEVKFAQWTRAGIVRHGAYVALREDKKAHDVVREQHATSAATATTSPSATATVAGIRLTHPDKVLYVDPVLTKRDLAAYYMALADWILPQVQQRPVTMVRCPHGSAGQCFFQRHAGKGTPAAVTTMTMPKSLAGGDCLLLEDIAALVATVQMGVLELHTWGASAEAPSRPDRIIFDLDPAPDLAWGAVIDGAQLLRGLLKEIGLTCFLKTTGGKGLHIVLPIVPEHDWATVKSWSHSLARHMASVLPDHFTATMSKSARRGKIFIDYLRNGPGATAVAAYSPRARPGAPVSAPLGWAELSAQTTNDRYTVISMPHRLASLKRDPWHAYATCRQRLTRTILNVFACEATLP